tara:strand:+ start:94 stop:210 length:117 start_codon:yes stop_codon:yes gene_type:complete
LDLFEELVGVEATFEPEELIELEDMEIYGETSFGIAID